MTTILVSGARVYPSTDEHIVKDALASILALTGEGTNPHQFNNRLIHGGAAGLDTMAATAAQELLFTVDEYPAKWNTHTTNCPPSHRDLKTCKLAGHRRNAHMIEVARQAFATPEENVAMIAFPVGRESENLSRGTWNAINTAKSTELPVFVQFGKTTWPANDAARNMVSNFVTRWKPEPGTVGPEGQYHTAAVADCTLPF